MLPPARLVVLVTALWVGCATSRAGDARVSFPNATPGAARQVPATIYWPPGEGPFPALVLFHGCQGVSASDHNWARWLRDRGYVAFLVDSWAARSIADGCAAALPDVPNTERFDDAVGALRFLQVQSRVDRTRVGAIGWSNGGVFAMAVVNGPSLERAGRRGVALPPPGYRASVVLYPGGCASLTREYVTKPLLVLIGEADDWTVASKCREMIENMRSRGAPAEIVLYPGAHHYFDVEGQAKAFLPDVGNENRPSGAGATVAFDAAANADAHRRVEQFLARYLGRADMDASVELVRHLTECVVNIQTTVARDHRSVPILGTERMGSGVVVDPGGLILTVNYVVMGGQTVQVSFLRGRRIRAEIVAQDFDVSLALLRIKRQGLTAAPLRAEGELERGEPVVAVASTGAQERRVSGGVVTYLGEFEAHWEYLLENGIISSAANPGFGGGGLFTLKARLAGIVSLNLNELLRNSLSIPVDYYREHEREFLRFGRVVSRPRRAWLGVFAHAIEEGIVVAGVVPEGPGDRGGLREGDLIVSLNAEKLESRRDLYVSLWRHEPGDHLTFEVMRDSVLRRVQVTGGDRAEFFRQP